MSNPCQYPIFGRHESAAGVVPKDYRLDEASGIWVHPKDWAAFQKDLLDRYSGLREQGYTSRGLTQAEAPSLSQRPARRVRAAA